jgi:hypothetical protein
MRILVFVCLACVAVSTPQTLNKQGTDVEDSIVIARETDDGWAGLGSARA